MSDTLEASYNDEAEKRKITKAHKVFFVLSLRASGMMLSLQIVRFQSSNLLRISGTLKLIAPPEFIKSRSGAKGPYSYNI